MATQPDQGELGNGSFYPSPTPDPSRDQGRQYPPLKPEVQQALTALVGRMRLAVQRQQLNADVQAQLHRLAVDLAQYTNPDLLIEPLTVALMSDRLSDQARQELVQVLAKLHTEADAHQRLNRLAHQVEQCLSRQTVPPQVQTELARLLSLMSSIRHYPHYISELELAVSALLPGVFNQDAAAQAIAIAPDPPPSLPGQAPPLPPPPDTAAKGLTLARKIRNHLRLITRQHPFPLQSLLSASGSGQNRLLSGLSWFLIIFSLLPALAYGGVIILGVGRIQTLEQQLENTEADLERVRQERRLDRRRAVFYENNLGSVGTRLERINNRNDRLLRDGAESANSWLGYHRQVAGRRQDNLKDRFDPVRDSLGIAPFQAEDEAELTTQLETLGDYGDLAQLLLTLDKMTRPESVEALDDPIPAMPSWGLQQALLDQIDAEVQGQRGLIKEGQALVDESFADTDADLDSEEDANAEALEEETPQEETAESEEEEPEEQDRLLQIVIDGLIDTANEVDLPLILAVVSAGALGGFVSVIVRSSDLVQGAEKKPLDLFFVGFFRPVVGMTFAFFLVAVIESGILSGIFTLGRQEGAEGSDRSIYLYIAISFVAGFSERLVRDFVVQTERQITGLPPSQDTSDGQDR